MKYLTLGLLAIPFLSSQAIAQDYPSVRVSAIDEPVCFMDTSRVQRFDLTSLCGVTPAPAPASAATTVPIAVPAPPSPNRAPTGRNSGTSSSVPSGSAIPQSVPPTAPTASTIPLFQPGQSLSGNGNSLSGGGSSGTCNSPSDLAADGSRCGDRAASQRPGGR